MFLKIISKNVDALRPEAKRLLVCSSDEYKQLQKMPMDISLQRSLNAWCAGSLGKMNLHIFQESGG